MTIVYIAEDGRRFNNEDECQEYENSLMYEKYVQQKLIKGFDITGDEIKYSEATFLDKVYSFYLANQEAANEYNRRVKQEGFREPLFEFGIAYAWDEDNTCWIDIEERIEDLTEQLEKIKKIKKLLTE